MLAKTPGKGMRTKDARLPGEAIQQGTGSFAGKEGNPMT
ncbi:hypothetical protein JOC33_003444 [Thalassobacillus pellis]|nr:hypothetical protein [Thalassobacillus pellis]